MTNLGPAASPWDTSAPVSSVSATEGNVTLVEGQTFCISDRRGDMSASVPHGLFILDTRVLSRFELRLNGHPLEPLAVANHEPFSATFATRAAPVAGAADTDFVVFRIRHIGGGLRERLTITNYGLRPGAAVIELMCDADFADLFAVKESRVRTRGDRVHSIEHQALIFTHHDVASVRRTAVHLSLPALIEPGWARWGETLEPGETWELCLEVTVELAHAEIESRFRCDQASDEASTPRRRLDAWQARLPTVTTDNPDLANAIITAGRDLGALQIFDRDQPELPIIAAGAPWFMTVFGRDSLLTAWMTLIADPSLAHGVLETLARFQGDDIQPQHDEEPGKILHEMRSHAADGPDLGDADVYYGSVDATPLFVMLLGEWARWGYSGELVARLLVHADRALEWIEHFGDRDGDGYVEYQGTKPGGLANQGWKDSWDAIRFADGTLPRPPIAVCEVQGYVYAAYLARAHFARQAGDDNLYRHYQLKAAELRRRFNEEFWLDQHGTFALGLDADKRPIDSIASNVGHCLWTGIVDPERAPVVADRMFQPDLYCGWGIRTLATSMAAYNPVSYHNGSVWPHDNAICAAGLARYGLSDHAQRIIEGQLATAHAHAHRLPELFAGFPREQLAVPGAYPASCSPQAWAAASPLLWLRTLLGLDPCIPHGKVWISPALPASVNHLRANGIQLGDSRLDIEIHNHTVHVETSGPSIDIVTDPRPPISTIVTTC